METVRIHKDASEVFECVMGDAEKTVGGEPITVDAYWSNTIPRMTCTLKDITSTRRRVWWKPWTWFRRGWTVTYHLSVDTEGT